MDPVTQALVALAAVLALSFVLIVLLVSIGRSCRDIQRDLRGMSATLDTMDELLSDITVTRVRMDAALERAMLAACAAERATRTSVNVKRVH